MGLGGVLQPDFPGLFCRSYVTELYAKKAREGSDPLQLLFLFLSSFFFFFVFVFLSFFSMGLVYCSSEVRLGR